ERKKRNGTWCSFAGIVTLMTPIKILYRSCGISFYYFCQRVIKFHAAYGKLP
ncbi:hypothetical protein K0M31_005903, partial [Melipona bicolor]